MKGTFKSETHQYFIDGVEIYSNTQILKLAGLIDDRWYTDHGKDRGHAVHLGCQLLDEESLDWASLDLEIEPYVIAYERFKRESGFIPDIIEVPFYNYPHRYGTTIDRTGPMNGRKILLELKSGAVEPWCALQLALQNECLPQRLPKFALQLKSDGTYQLHEFKDPNDRNVALAAVAIVHWKENQGEIYANRNAA